MFAPTRSCAVFIAMLKGKKVNVDENGRIIREDNQIWDVPAQGFAHFVAAHGGIQAKGLTANKQGTKVPHIICADGTEIWGSENVGQKFAESRAAKSPFSMLATMVGGYRRTVVDADEDGVAQTYEALDEQGNSVYGYTAFLPTLEEAEDLVVY